MNKRDEFERTRRLGLWHARDREQDGRFLAGVVTTGIYCLPSCPARRPKDENVRFFGDEAAARAAEDRTLDHDHHETEDREVESDLTGLPPQTARKCPRRKILIGARIRGVRHERRLPKHECLVIDRDSERSSVWR